MMINSPDRRTPLWRRILFGAGIFIGVLVISWFALTKIIYQDYTVPTGAMETTIMAGDGILAHHASFDNGRLPERGSIVIFKYPGNRDESEPLFDQVYVKRCVAVAGDVLEIRNGAVYVNGVKEDLPAEAQYKPTPYYLPERDQSATFPNGRMFTRDNWGPMRIPKKGDVLHLDVGDMEEWKVFIEREGHSVGLDAGRIRIDGEPATDYVVERDYLFGMGDNRNDSQDSRYWGFIPTANVIGIPFMVYFSKNPETGSVRWDRVFSGIR